MVERSDTTGFQSQTSAVRPGRGAGEDQQRREVPVPAPLPGRNRLNGTDRSGGVASLDHRLLASAPAGAPWRTIIEMSKLQGTALDFSDAARSAVAGSR